MTNKQRINLLCAAHEHYTIDSNDQHNIRVRFKDVIIKVHYNIDHGLGDGDIVGIISTNSEPIPTVAECDKIILDVAKMYRDELMAGLEAVTEAIDSVARKE